MKFAPARFAALALGLLLAALGLRATAADLAEVRARGVLRHLGIPYANFVKAGDQGFDVELVRGFAAHLGVRYELVHTDFYNAIQDLLGAEVVRKGGEVALEGSRPVRGDLIAAGFTVLPWRQKLVLYSAPTFPSQVLLVARTESTYKPISPQSTLKAGMAETRKVLARHSLLVMERTCLDPSNYGLTDRGIDLRSLKGSTNLDDMVPALLRGEAEFTLLDVPDAVIDLQRWAGRIKVIGPISEHQELAAAFPKSAPALRAAFDDYLRGLRVTGAYDQLVNRHYPGIRNYFPEFFARRD
jgi:ABC-type amino acid transport substrate-binding protein